ncbi:MAG: hypothetical protein JNN01_03640 [Opitutaceae bacterium]|nr:hypothetical protein [Opitutaceae bacterium]
MLKNKQEGALPSASTTKRVAHSRYQRLTLSRNPSAYFPQLKRIDPLINHGWTQIKADSERVECFTQQVNAALA